MIDHAEDDDDVFVDRQTRAYTGGRKQRYYGDIAPDNQRELETRVTIRIAVTKTNIDAVFK